MFAELRWPGTSLDVGDDADNHEISALIGVMSSGLEEANLALLLFRAAQASHRPVTRETFMADRAERRAIEEELTGSRDGPLLGEDRWNLDQQVDRILRSRRWERERRLPRSLEWNLPFLHAKSFVYGLDAIVKAVAVLAAHARPGTSRQALDAMTQVVPDLVAVRNTAHHMEDRARGLRKGGQPLDLKPLGDAPEGAPGSILILDCLEGETFSTTVADGGVGHVTVDEATLGVARDAVQTVLDGYSWTGPPRLTPT